MKGLEPKWQRAAWRSMGPENKHKTDKVLLISSTELLLAHWPSTVAIQVCAVAMNVSVTDNIYILSEVKYCLHPFLAELLARYITTRSQNWGTSFGMFRYFFGTEIDCIDPEYGTPTFDCLATTGPHMSKENLKHYVGERLPPRTSIQTYGHNKEIAVIQIDQSNEFRRELPRPTETPNTDYDSRHIFPSRTSIRNNWSFPYSSEYHPWSSKGSQILRG